MTTTYTFYCLTLALLATAFVTSTVICFLSFLKLHARSKTAEVGVNWIRASMTITCIWLVVWLTEASMAFHVDRSGITGPSTLHSILDHLEGARTLLSVVTSATIMSTEAELVVTLKQDVKIKNTRTLTWALWTFILFLGLIRFIFYEISLTTHDAEVIYSASAYMEMALYVVICLIAFVPFICLVLYRSMLPNSIFFLLLVAYFLTVGRLGFSIAQDVLVGIGADQHDAYLTLPNWIRVAEAGVVGWAAVMTMTIIYSAIPKPKKKRPTRRSRFSTASDMSFNCQDTLYWDALTKSKDSSIGSNQV
ncbi:unnamed protein product [Clonostachys solani]|uniref:Uncharacterized protein n=1 Tax=Clonostachys solani TaxID=160281 RepID=A0A9N9ZG25_9HYPO|nr:unnamed protein product [Clonostachys solani]